MSLRFWQNKRLGQTGDTIVEVLLATAVLTLVIAGGYQIASRSTKQTQQVQEHTQALKLAEAQIESLKARAENNADIFGRGSGFCMDNNNTPQSINNGSPTSSVPDTLTTANYPTACQKDVTSPTSANCGSSLCYYIGIRESSNLFTVTVRWLGINGGQDEVKLLYRLYQ